MFFDSQIRKNCHIVQLTFSSSLPFLHHGLSATTPVRIWNVSKDSCSTHESVHFRISTAVAIQVISMSIIKISPGQDARSQRAAYLFVHIARSHSHQHQADATHDGDVIGIHEALQRKATRTFDQFNHFSATEPHPPSYAAFRLKIPGASSPSLSMQSQDFHVTMRKNQTCHSCPFRAPSQRAATVGSTCNGPARELLLHVGVSFAVPMFLVVSGG